MKLAPVTKQQCQIALKWRTEQRDILRTPYFLTAEMQDNFYRDVICNRNSFNRFYAIVDSTMIFQGEPIEKFMGLGGLINIQWENSTAELSLITSVREEEKPKMFDLLLKEGFSRLNLQSVYGETYKCGDIKTSKAVIKKYDAYNVVLPKRKYVDGQYYDAIWWMIDRGKYDNCC